MLSLSNKTTLLVNESWILHSVIKPPAVYELVITAGQVDTVTLPPAAGHEHLFMYGMEMGSAPHINLENYSSQKTLDYFSLKSNIVIFPKRNYPTSVNKYFDLFYKLSTIE